jgi:hypothetical protein
MRSFRVLFYRPDYDHRWLDNAIGWYSFLVNSIARPTQIGLLKKLLSSHVEIWTPDKDGVFMAIKTFGEIEATMFSDKHGVTVDYIFPKDYHEFEGVCWTSTMGQTGTVQENGCVRRPASEVLTTPRRWYYYEFEVCTEAYEYMVKWMEHQVADNICYDKAELAKFFLPIRTQNPDDHKKICSGFSWVAAYKAWCRDIIAHHGNVDLSLIRKHKINDLFSPLLMSYHLFKAGAKPIDLETGKEIKP